MATSLITRRWMFQLAGVAGVGGLMLAGGRPALGDTPSPVGRQVAGFYRFPVGDFEVTVVSDGWLDIQPLSLFSPNAPEAELTRILEDNYLPTDHVAAHMNLTLVNTGEHLVLLDTGVGAARDTGGRVAANLRAAGIDPADIDTIVITHGHPDHIGGIIDAATGERQFPNAAYFITETEWNFWNDPATLTQAPDGMKPVVEGARRIFDPIGELTSRIASGTEIVPGIRSIDAPGHTYGHQAVRIASGRDQVIVSGDAIVHGVVSFAHPEWYFGFDMEPEVAVATRRALLDEMATDRLTMIGYHLPFPGLGHVGRAGDAYRWVPASYRWDL